MPYLINICIFVKDDMFTSKEMLLFPLHLLKVTYEKWILIIYEKVGVFNTVEVESVNGCWWLQKFAS